MDQQCTMDGFRKLQRKTDPKLIQDKLSFAGNPSCQNALQLSKKHQGLEKEFE